MFSWLKNKVANNNEVDNCIYYVNYEVTPAKRIELLGKIVSLILIGLTRMKLEGISPTAYGDIFKSVKNDVMFKYNLKSCKHDEFVVPYIVYIFFQNFGFMDTANGIELFKKMGHFILQYEPYDEKHTLTEINKLILSIGSN